MTDQDFERKEKARQDAIFDAQFADEPTSDVEYADEPQINGWPLYSGLPQPIKPTQEQVIAWAREAGVHEQWFKGDDCPPIVFRLATLAYEAGRKDENERICEAIKNEDDYCVDNGDYMLDSNDCIAIVRGTWVRPQFAAQHHSKIHARIEQ